ncbi:hypothetical protein [Alphabaculovirus altersperidaniae]|uniref:Uncharacterized protein n=1 Tax=Spodoptera eridania nucleopolyhedrovirus TaxID=2315721 RepID=A0ABX6TQA1_9ABAC|nr:hypothetical protein QKS47_gp023 [Spodoptera eridania nucleopolyhedrovirus]QNV47779.1 hypothetical protein [Spodoptera eridania nucleopolyhedrovirus]
MIKLIYQSPDFNRNKPLILLSQYLLKDNEQKAKVVLADLVAKGYNLCVTADYRKVITKIDPITGEKIKVDISEKYRRKMKKTLIKWKYPVRFGHLDEFAGYKFDIDTDDWDRIDVDGLWKKIKMMKNGKMITKKVPVYICNDYIFNYYKKLKNK